MKKLGIRNYTLISQGVNMMGTFDPQKIFFVFEESLYVDEGETIEEFLEWCHANDKRFGISNYEERFSEFLREKAISENKRAFHNLNEKDRETVSVHVFEGLTNREMAIRLGIPIDTARSRILRAKKRVKYIISQL